MVIIEKAIELKESLKAKNLSSITKTGIDTIKRAFKGLSVSQEKADKINKAIEDSIEKYLE